MLMSELEWLLVGAAVDALCCCFAVGLLNEGSLLHAAQYNDRGSGRTLVRGVVQRVVVCVEMKTAVMDARWAKWVFHGLAWCWFRFDSIIAGNVHGWEGYSGARVCQLLSF